jgi:hypothetical protein
MRNHLNLIIMTEVIYIAQFIQTSLYPEVIHPAWDASRQQKLLQTVSQSPQVVSFENNERFE